VAPLDPNARLLERRPVDVHAEPFAEWLERAPVLGEVSIETVVYESSGAPVDAFAVFPPGVRAAPTVLYARGGGPHNAVNPFIVSTHLAPLAAAGFTVVATQYRKPPHGQDEFGGAEVADLVNAAALLEHLPEANPNRVGLVGWSRGAMMVHLALARAPTAFRAAVCAAGVVDQFAELERRPRMEEVLSAAIPNFAEHRDRELARRSVLRWAEKLPREVPILLLHGSADWRVSPHESLKLAARFLDLGQPHRLVLYEGAEHGIREFRAEVNAEIAQWFERYLDPAAVLPDMTPHGR
jgi:dipeptidyl aminopeptidase/acylaminoacyl peptidase